MTLQWKIPLLASLYFIQGIPYGFQSRFLPVYLRNLGQSLTSLTFYKLLLTPWLCKALWAPFIDKYGHQRLWLLMSILGLALASLLCAFISPLTLGNMTILSMVLFIMNILAATQDISVDRMALELLTDDELGIGNTAQVVGYKFGALFGGGIVLYLVERTGWRTLFILISLLYFGSASFLLLVPSVGTSQTKKTDEKMKLGYWRILRTVLESPGTKWMLGYLLVYKLGEQGALSLLPLYLVDHGISLSDIALWTGILGQGVSILGSTLAGYLLSRRGAEPHGLIKRLFMVQFLPLAVLYLVTMSRSGLQYKFGVAILCMYLLLLISGLVTTATFTAMMQYSQLAPPNVRATHYSVLATVEIFGKLTFASFSGYLTDVFGYSNMYLLFIGLSGLVPVYLRTRRDVRWRDGYQSTAEKHDAAERTMR